MKNLMKRYDVFLTILFFLLAIPAERFELFSLLEDQTISFRHILRSSYGSPEKTGFTKDIVLVNTDEEFFKDYKSFPLRRTDIGHIVENLSFLGAKVIALDILMDFPSSYNEDPETARNLKEAGNTLLVSQAQFNNGKFVKINYPTTQLDEASRSGYTNIGSTSSIVTTLSRLRVHPEITKLRDGWPFAVTALSMFWDVEPKLEGNTLTFGDKATIQLDQFNEFYIDFPTLMPGTQFLSQSAGITALEFIDMSDLDEDEIDELRYWIEGKLVLIGDTSEVSHDWFDTPVGMVYGVEVIADSIHTLMKGAPLQPASMPVEIIASLSFMIAILISGKIQHPTLRMGAAILGAAIFIGVVTALYIHADLVISMSYALLAGLLGFFTINLRLFVKERGQKKMIKGAFGQYLSPKVVDILVKDPTKLSLGGEQREMTAFFSDVAAFSTISEKLTPNELVQLLNKYLTAMCDIIAQQDGTVDKFEGDAIIAFWGAPLDQPDHAIRACHASIDMSNHMVLMREELAKVDGPLMTVRMGLNSGPMVVGNMGSAQRMDYTIMGDAVNLAARLEGANKFFTSGTMISQFTYELAKDEIDCRLLDTVRVVGKKEPITIYQLLERKNQTPSTLADVVEQYNRAMVLYKDMDFVGARDAFKKALDLMPDDGPSTSMIDRCSLFIQDPPPSDWDRVFNLTSKG
ncbi:MAG: adenylate/guanylate cyclase domain-containing protein [Magnetococcales bacterium]|nr:adenylate/guanylate cyclase domain-containing protein [Magnetococcales bacterium]